MKPARALARLNGRILNAYSRRTTTALRAVLPLRLALPHLEPVLVLNVDKEVKKDTLVILCAGELLQAGQPDWTKILPQLLSATREIDREFISHVGAFPIDIVIRYEEIAPVRTRRMQLLCDAAMKILAARNDHSGLRSAMRATFSQGEFAQLLNQLFCLYAEEVRSLSRSVRLPALLVPLRELIAQGLLKVMLEVAHPLAREIADLAYRPMAPVRNE